MKGELLYVYHPIRQRIIWAIVYAVIIVGTLTSFYYIGNKIATHTIPVGDVQLSVPYSKYLVGESVTFTLHNGFNSTIYVINNCPDEPLEVFRQENNTWVRIHDKAAIGDCSSNERQIAVTANSSISGTYEAWKNLFSTPGKYRIVAYVEYYNALPYEDFEIIAKPEVSSAKDVTTAPVQNNTTQNNENSASKQITSEPTSNLQSKIINVEGGSINIQYDSSNIYIVSITPSAGYTYQTSKEDGGLQVTFKNGQTEIQVSLRVSNGQLVVHTEQGD
jgi:uncharacterized membrane protein